LLAKVAQPFKGAGSTEWSPQLSLKHIGDVAERYNNQPSLKFAQAVLDPRSDIFEIEGIVIVGDILGSHSYACLTRSPDSFHGALWPSWNG